MRIDMDTFREAFGAEATRGNLLFAFLPLTFGMTVCTLCLGFGSTALTAQMLGGLIMAIAVVLTGSVADDAVLHLGQRTLVITALALSVLAIAGIFVSREVGCAVATFAVVSYGTLLATLREKFITQEMISATGERRAAQILLALIPILAAAFINLAASSTVMAYALSTGLAAAVIAIRLFVPLATPRTARRSTPRLREPQRPPGRPALQAGRTSRTSLPAAGSPRTSRPVATATACMSPAPGRASAPSAVAALEARRRSRTHH